jgi:hypothetical protein
MLRTPKSQANHEEKFLRLVQGAPSRLSARTSDTRLLWALFPSNTWARRGWPGVLGVAAAAASEADGVAAGQASPATRKPMR